MKTLRSLRQYYRPIYAATALGVIVTLFVLLVLQGRPFFSHSELAAYDFQFQLRGNLHTPQNIRVVGVDAASIDDLASGKYPPPRHLIAQAVTFLHRAGAAAIGIDFYYPAASTARDDEALAKAIKQAGNVVVVQLLNGSSAQSNAETMSLTPPIDPIARAVADLGVANVPVDPDNVTRATYPMQYGPGSKYYPSLAVSVASIATHRPVSEVMHGLPQDVMQINYVGPQDPGNPNSYSFVTRQLDGVARGEDNPADYRGKIVLIVPYAPAFHDELLTPFGAMYGGVVQANALNTILQRNPVLPAGGTNNSLIVILVGLLTTLLASRFGIYRSIGAVLVLAAGYAFLTFFLFQHFLTWINLITPETAILLSFASIMSLRFATEERAKWRTRKIFGQYLKPEIVDLLVTAPDEDMALAGARRPITNLFVDIRGFTAMSELMEPEQVVDALDIYLEELTNSVQAFEGTVDKYVGDELMAIWNAPFLQRDHALLAIQCGLDMVDRNARINEQLKAQGLPQVRYGIGINTGDAVVGQMGSTLRKQYDVIGDSVNTGARLCSAAGGAEIIIGESTWELVGDRLEVEETEPLRLKGKSKPFRTFKVLSIKPEVPSGAQPVVPVAQTT